MKWHGKVGYVTTEPKEEGSDVYIPMRREISYYGEVMSQRTSYSSGFGSNDNITVNSTKISIIADMYAYDNSQHIKYVEYRNNLWEVTSIDDAQRPRIILTLGGVYNGSKS